MAKRQVKPEAAEQPPPRHPHNPQAVETLRCFEGRNVNISLLPYDSGGHIGRLGASDINIDMPHGVMSAGGAAWRGQTSFGKWQDINGPMSGLINPSSLVAWERGIFALHNNTTPIYTGEAPSFWSSIRNRRVVSFVAFPPTAIYAVCEGATVDYGFTNPSFAPAKTFLSAVFWGTITDNRNVT